MRKQEQLWCAERCHLFMQFKHCGPAKYWEKRMYEHLFMWAGWKP